jgi:anti-sigma B factor antagonist
MPKIPHFLSSMFGPIKPSKFLDDGMLSSKKTQASSEKSSHLRLNFESAFIRKEIISIAHRFGLTLRGANQQSIKNKITSLWGIMVANLPIEEFDKEGIHVFRVGGRLDATSAPILERKLVHIVETPGAKVVVDLKNLSYLSSAGMRVMLAASKRLKSVNGYIAFSSLQEPVMEIIKLAGFEHVLKFYPTEAAALKSLKTTPES